MPTLNISLNKELADLVDMEMKTGKYANRSECIRAILRKYFYNSSIYRDDFLRDLNESILEYHKDEFRKAETLRDLTGD